jgi:glycosyltransferase involved in cell wall biosynthesis
MPLVSVVIATYGRPSLLKRAVGCALSQTVPDLEVIVVVEKGDAPSVGALREISDSRVKQVTNPEKRGPAAARDFGVSSAAGDWIAFLDDDDEWLPEKLEKQLHAVGDRTAVICTALSYVKSPVGMLVRPTQPYSDVEPIDEWLFGRPFWFRAGVSMLQTSSLLVPRKLFGEINFGQSRHEEWELVIRAVKQLGYELETVNEPLVVYYTGNNFSWERSIPWIDSMIDVISREAYSGFCLTVVPQGIEGKGRSAAFLVLLKAALRNGSPTARQLFAFLMIWLIPHGWRQRGRVAISNLRAGPKAHASN